MNYILLYLSIYQNRGFGRTAPIRKVPGRRSSRNWGSPWWDESSPPIFSTYLLGKVTDGTWSAASPDHGWTGEWFTPQFVFPWIETVRAIGLLQWSSGIVSARSEGFLSHMPNQQRNTDRCDIQNWQCYPVLNRRAIVNVVSQRPIQNDVFADKPLDDLGRARRARRGMPSTTKRYICL